MCLRKSELLTLHMYNIYWSQVITGNANVPRNECHWNLSLFVTWYLGHVKTFVGENNLNWSEYLGYCCSYRAKSTAIPNLRLNRLARPRLRQRHGSVRPGRKHPKTEKFPEAILFAPTYRVTPFHLFNLAPEIIYIRQRVGRGWATLAQ